MTKSQNSVHLWKRGGEGIEGRDTRNLSEVIPTFYKGVSYTGTSICQNSEYTHKICTDFTLKDKSLNKFLTLDNDMHLVYLGEDTEMPTIYIDVHQKKIN